MQKFCSTLLLFCSVLLCAPQPSAHAEDLAVPANISIQDVFFNFLQFYHQRQEDLEEVFFSTLTEQEQATVMFALKLKAYIACSDMYKYTNTLQKYLVPTDKDSVKIQKNTIIDDSIKIPYIYIDEKYKFIKFIPDYSDKEKLENIIGLCEDDTASACKDFMETFYVKLLPFKARTSSEYLLVVAIKHYGFYTDIWDFWLYTVAIQEANAKMPFIFTEIQHDQKLAPGQSTSLIEPYYSSDFDPEGKMNLLQDRYIRGSLSDMDKFTGDFFIYYTKSATSALHFVWDGEKYIKKGLVQRDYAQARKAMRGQE